MSVRVDVPSGDGSKVGFSVEKTDNAILIFGGPLQGEDSMFGITNDEGGVGVNAYPVQPLVQPLTMTVYLVIKTIVGAQMNSLRGPLTLTRLSPDPAVICTQLDYTWMFSLTRDFPEWWENDFTQGWAWMGDHGPGTGKLIAGSYKLDVYWYGYTVAWNEVSARALQTFYFTVPETRFGVLLGGGIQTKKITTEPEW